MRPPSFSVSQNHSGATSRAPPLARGMHCFSGTQSALNWNDGKQKGNRHGSQSILENGSRRRRPDGDMRNAVAIAEAMEVSLNRGDHFTHAKKIPRLT
jgi:hypothetical protein